MTPRMAWNSRVSCRIIFTWTPWSQHLPVWDSGLVSHLISTSSVSEQANPAALSSRHPPSAIGTKAIEYQPRQGQWGVTGNIKQQNCTTYCTHPTGCLLQQCLTCTLTFLIEEIKLDLWQLLLWASFIVERYNTVHSLFRVTLRPCIPLQFIK